MPRKQRKPPLTAAERHERRASPEVAAACEAAVEESIANTMKELATAGELISYAVVGRVLGVARSVLTRAVQSGDLAATKAPPRILRASIPGFIRSRVRK